MNTQDLGKFFKGALTGGGTALTAFLVDSGCRITSLNEFGYAASLAVGSGLFHMFWNKYVSGRPTQSET